MAKSITVDNVDLAQVVLMKDKASGKLVVLATYQLKAGGQVVGTTADRALTFVPRTGAVAQTDAMTTLEQSSASTTWDAVTAAVQRLEL